MTIILALDFGGTKLAAALVNIGSRKWLRYERRLSPANANASTDLEIMRSVIYSLVQDAKPAGEILEKEAQRRGGLRDGEVLRGLGGRIVGKWCVRWRGRRLYQKLILKLSQRFWGMMHRCGGRWL
ncbi:hypothetical protein [Nostoc sp. FACHB-888]|uniref:hypothetical protein n=1 Tax=Nostoc sp. FACHB-888 TaxID=2692842 RepID=UPI001E5E2B79|nr:hypothetical protein [Nostoc sp. FACHB-888]MCC5651964.1 hypothetical protein [Nostoc sp. XA013]